MPKKCEHCGSLSVEEEEQVCSSCGIVVEGISFGSEYTKRSFTNNYHKGDRRTAGRLVNSIRPPQILTYAIDILKNLCHVYNIPSIRSIELEEMLKNVYPKRRFRAKEDLSIVGGCCLFLMQRQLNQSIPLAEMCRRLQCTKKKFNYYLKIVKSQFSPKDESDSPTSDDSEVGALAQGHEINPSLLEIAESMVSVVCNPSPEDEKSKLIKKTVELVKLANSCWLVTGRSPYSAVVACAFLCWKSMHPSRKKAPYARFCSEFNIREPVALYKIRELKAVLLKLGGKIPSLTKNYVNDDNLLFHLDTILENSETLRNDLLQDQCSTEEMCSKEYDTFRFPVRNPPRKVSESAVTYESDMNASDIEILDSEIESYIINDPQKTMIENLCDKKSF